MSTTEEIIRALPVDFVRRMRNWARANAGLGIDGVRAVDFDVEYGWSGYREATIPTSDGEAVDTDSALALVPVRYRQAVALFWQYEGNSLRWFGRRSRVHRETFEQWLQIGHDRLNCELRRRAEATLRLAIANARAIREQRALIAS